MFFSFQISIDIPLKARKIYSYLKKKDHESKKLDQNLKKKTRKKDSAGALPYGP